MTQNFGYRVIDNLSGFSTLIEDKAKRWMQISGNLPLSSVDFSTNKEALCKFEINSHWWYEMPSISCSETWLRKNNPDWHTLNEDGLCFELDLKWKQELQKMINQHTLGEVAEYGVLWLINSTRSLLQRHLFAHRTGMKTWAQRWEFWDHERATAERQFLVTQSDSLSKGITS